MRNYKFFLNILLACTCILLCSTANAESRKTFIHKYKNIAIREMERTGIPASITLAQGILESGCGQSELAIHANNHFGIKCHDWTGETYHMDDDEKGECFRKYKNPEESWIDHSVFLTTRPRYAGLFDIPTTDYRAWARGLKAAGYATNPQYAEKLVKIIEEEELYKFDHPVTRNELADDVTGSPVTTPTGNLNNYLERQQMRNGIPYIQLTLGDTYEKIAAYYNVSIKKLLIYNDKVDTFVREGDVVYLKNKKTKAARGYEFHRAKAGESLYDIAQHYGIRLRNLLKNNYYTVETQLSEGEKVYLRSKADLY